MKIILRWFIVFACAFGFIDAQAQDFAIPANNCPKDAKMISSWNLKDFGSSKSDEVIDFMAKVLRKSNIVLAQEITTKEGGAQAVARLQDALNRKGKKWDALISDNTEPNSPGVERYTMFYDSSITTNRKKAHLVTDLQEAIDREPFTTKFVIDGHELDVFTVHLVPTAKKPIEEVKALVQSHEISLATNAIVAGDFNLGSKKTNKYFKSIGYTAQINQKTSIKRTVNAKGEYLLNQYDNIYTKGQMKVCASGVIDFVAEAYSPVTKKQLTEVYKVSDHLVVYAMFYFPK